MITGDDFVAAVVLKTWVSSKKGKPTTQISHNSIPFFFHVLVCVVLLCFDINRIEGISEQGCKWRREGSTTIWILIW